VLVVGGAPGNFPVASAELYDPQADAWSITGSLATARYLHGASILESGEVLIAGGVDPPDDLVSAEIYRPDGEDAIFADGFEFGP
jgi:hypothetical protein